MSKVANGGNARSDALNEEGRIVLGLLDSVGRDGAQSQRRLAAELGIALGLVNAYLRRCIGKGLVKVRAAPTRRYAYYLTPKGFAEKSRLTVSYLTNSLSFFRLAKAECVAIFERVRARGQSRVVLAGQSDLAEIAAICALDCGIQIVAVVDLNPKSERFLGAPVVKSLEEIDRCSYDAVVITEVENTYGAWKRATAQLGEDRIFLPPLLGVKPHEKRSRQ